jgi:hypothetical protein
VIDRYRELGLVDCATADSVAAEEKDQEQEEVTLRARYVPYVHSVVRRSTAYVRLLLLFTKHNKHCIPKDRVRASVWSVAGPLLSTGTPVAAVCGSVVTDDVHADRDTRTNVGVGLCPRLRGGGRSRGGHVDTAHLVFAGSSGGHDARIHFHTSSDDSFSLAFFFGFFFPETPFLPIKSHVCPLREPRAKHL